jgi:hypothetical protein
MKRKCTATTKAGRPCRAWAVHGTNPPRCQAHANLSDVGASGSAAEEEPSFYQRQLTSKEVADLVAHAGEGTLTDEIAINRIILRRLLTVLRENEALTMQDLTNVAPLVFRGTRAVARLLRQERALSGEAADGIAGAIGKALDELSTEIGLEL